MRRSLRVAVAISVVCVGGCGGSSSSTAPLETTNLVTNGTFTATVNGSAWGALGKVVVNRPTANSVALFAVSTTYGFTITLLKVTGPTTVSLAYDPTNGSQVIASGPSKGGWATGQPGTTGTAVITALTPTHIAGTFSFDAAAIAGTGSSGTLHVTNGVFDLTY